MTENYFVSLIYFVMNYVYMSSVLNLACYVPGMLLSVKRMQQLLTQNETRNSYHLILKGCVVQLIPLNMCCPKGVNFSFQLTFTDVPKIKEMVYNLLAKIFAFLPTLFSHPFSNGEVSVRKKRLHNHPSGQ